MQQLRMGLCPHILVSGRAEHPPARASSAHQHRTLTSSFVPTAGTLLEAPVLILISIQRGARRRFQIFLY